MRSQWCRLGDFTISEPTEKILLTTSWWYKRDPTDRSRLLLPRRDDPPTQDVWHDMQRLFSFFSQKSHGSWLKAVCLHCRLKESWSKSALVLQSSYFCIRMWWFQSRKCVMLSLIKKLCSWFWSETQNNGWETTSLSEKNQLNFFNPLYYIVLILSAINVKMVI